MIRSSKNILLTLSLISIFTGFLGCSFNAEKITADKSISSIIQMAAKAQAAKRYKQAGDLYMKVDELYPYSDESRQALLEAMKSYHAGSELTEARVAAKKYLILYENGEGAAFAKYMIGLSHFDAIVDVQRDQGSASFAVKEFSELISKYPDTDEAAKATKKLEVAFAQLAGQEMSVGRYYLQRQHYLAATRRFQTVVDTYSDTIFAVEAFYRLAEAYFALGMRPEFEMTKSILIERFPDSKWTLMVRELPSLPEP
ncbi:MAG: outer membrane protein assembly factor BamD [Pseudomonadota bacterium]|nr:outer membrane protein assembly factor BamD [Pseudomonadota bacterium]